MCGRGEAEARPWRGPGEAEAMRGEAGPCCVRGYNEASPRRGRGEAVPMRAEAEARP
jgi:hypothetical protein